MRTVEVRHGCFTPEVCGNQDHHTCGSADACPKVKSSGFVCTVGGMASTSFHSQADLDALQAEEEAQHEKAHGQKPDAIEKAVIKMLVRKGKNLETPEATAAAEEHGHRHGTNVLAFHDAHPEVFGHN